MKTHPFNQESVMRTKAFSLSDTKAILEGSKTRFMVDTTPHPSIRPHVPYEIGDIIGVKEWWAASYWCGVVFINFAYKADKGLLHESIKYKHPATMPDEAIRIFLEITGRREHHLQDITEDEIKQEGFLYPPPYSGFWNSNPAMIGYTFRVVEKGERG